MPTCALLRLQVIAWEVDRHMQLLCKCSMTEKGGSIRHVVWGSSSAGQQQPPGPAAATAAAAQQDRPVAFYTACAPDNTKAVTVKWLELGGSSGVVQVRALAEEEEQQQQQVVWQDRHCMLLQQPAAATGLATRNLRTWARRCWSCCTTQSGSSCWW